MTIPTQVELYAETDRQFRARRPEAPERLDPDDPDQADYVREWLELRDAIVNDWTDAAFAELYPNVGPLDPGNPEHAQMIDVWLDIRDQIRDGAAARFDLSVLRAQRELWVLSVTQKSPGIFDFVFNRPTNLQEVSDFMTANGFHEFGLGANPGDQHVEVQNLTLNQLAGVPDYLVSMIMDATILTAD